jgi:hypothetical protein
MARTSLTEKDEFVNKSDGWIGVVQLDHQGAAGGIAVAPGGSAFLSEEEQILTANAPVSDEDNPFANGSLELRTRSANIKSRRPWGAPASAAPAPAVQDEETGAAPLPAGDAPEGSRPAGEEVGAPAVVKGPATMRKRK